MKGKEILLAAILGALTFSTAACGSGTTPTEGASGEDFLLREVVLSEYKIEPDHIKVESKRPVRFLVKNNGNFTHEFRILLNPPKYVEVAPKSKDRLDVVFDKGGEYEYVCALNDHERRGMKGEISVETIE